MKERLEQWLTNNRLAFHFETDYLFSIGDKWFFVVEGIKTDTHTTIVNDRMELSMSDEDAERIGAVQGEIDYCVYEFGTRWYYTETEKATLRELRYVGKEKDLVETFPILGVHGGFDICNGSRSYADWCKKAAFCGVDTLGIAEENTLAGTLEFQVTCEKNKIKPIIGETVTVRSDTETYQIKLYVESQEGWKNLLLINSFINVHNEDRFITEEQLFNHTQGLIVILSPLVKLDQRLVYVQYFGKVLFQIDVSQWDSPQRDEEWLKAIQNYFEHDYSRKYGVPIHPIFVNDAYYLEREDAFIRKDLNAIGKVSFKNQSSDQYFKTPTEILLQLLELLPDNGGASQFVEKALFYTNFFKEIEFKIETGKLYLPEYIMTEEEKLQYDDKDNLLWALIEKGMEEKIIGRVKSEDEYIDRIQTEMKVICEAKLQDYFLITWDILNWCQRNGIMTGYGRGSAAGCLVSYLIGIVQTDPLQYGLMFERFLNEGRLYKKKKVKGYKVTHEDGSIIEAEHISDELARDIERYDLSVEKAEIEIKVTGSMPDIDNDIAGERRDEVKRYIESRYGAHRVAGIGTYGALKIKSALGALMTRIGIPSPKKAFITGCLGDNDSLTYDQFIEFAINDKPIKDFILEHPELVEKIPLILNQPNTASSHAAGLIIVPESENGIYDQMPVKKMDGILISEWEMGYVESAGFLKMDLLGLKQLDKFTEILSLIEQHTGETLTLKDIPLDDKTVYEYFSEGFNEDVFQFGGGGLKGYTRDMKPTEIDHLIATVALYRPGPIDTKAHLQYIERKGNAKMIEYPWGTKEVLKDTYGNIVYQEQVIKIVQVVGGFTANQADDVRKAMGKKDAKLMKESKDKFVEGAKKKGCPQEEAEELWDSMEVFAGYAFNKSHATCYAITGYYCQWFKVHYPVQFWLVTLKYSNATQLPNRLAEMAAIGGMKLGGPDINKSTDTFTTDSRKIFWSLISIKQVGQQAMIDILKERENGEFYSISEFASRMKGTAVKKNVIVNLILAGAFDSLHKVEENTLLKRFSILSEYMNFIGSKVDESITAMQRWKNYQFIIKQRELCGLGILNVGSFYKSVNLEGHRINTDTGKINKRTLSVKDKGDLKFYDFDYVLNNPAEDLSYKKKYPMVGGLLVKIEEKAARKDKNNKFALLEISDGINVLSGVIFGQAYAAHKELLHSKLNDVVFFNDVWIKPPHAYSRTNTFQFNDGSEIIIIT